MEKIVLYIDGSIRRISLLSFALVYCGALLTKNNNILEIVTASIGATLAVSLINSHNGLTDAKWDKLNPNKYTLGVHKPVLATLIVVGLIVLVKLSLVIGLYNTTMLNFLILVGFWYNSFFVRITNIKELTVAVSIGGLLFLAILDINPYFIFAVALTIYTFFIREKMKRRLYNDYIEDKYKLLKWPPSLDWWCITGPMMAPLLYLGLSFYIQNKLSAKDMLIAGCLSILVYGYMQRKNDYKISFLNNDILGKISLLFGLCLLPLTSLLPLGIVSINTLSMFRANFDHKVIQISLFHAWLWSTVVLLAATVHNNTSITIILFTGLVFISVSIYEYYRPRNNLTTVG